MGPVIQLLQSHFLIAVSDVMAEALEHQGRPYISHEKVEEYKELNESCIQN